MDRDLVYLYDTSEFIDQKDKLMDKDTINSFLSKKILQYHLHRSEISIHYLENIKKNDAGKPYFEDLPLCFSVSHSNNLICIAISNKNIGVDIQHKKKFKNHIAKHYFTSREKKTIGYPDIDINAFYKIWCSKEAVIKYLGTSLAKEIVNTEILIEDNKISCNPYSKLGFNLTEIKKNDAYEIIVCHHNNAVICERLYYYDLFK